MVSGAVRQGTFSGEPRACIMSPHSSTRRQPSMTTPSASRETNMSLVSGASPGTK